MSERIDDLFRKTLAGDYDDEAPWAAIHELRRDGSQRIFDHAAMWCASGNPLMRARGLDVLAQIGKTVANPEHAFPNESYSIVVRLLQQENEVLPLMSAIFALGHIGNPEAIPIIANYQSHLNPDVRHAVACALGSFPNDSRSIQSLLLLSRDEDKDVRDWATFGLGVIGDADSVEIREALFQRLDDPNQEVREEAMSGLAKRRDHRVLLPLIEELRQRAVASPVIEAACAMLGMERENDSWGTRNTGKLLRKSSRPFLDKTCPILRAFSLPTLPPLVCITVLFTPKSLPLNHLRRANYPCRAYNFCSRFY